MKRGSTGTLPRGVAKKPGVKSIEKGKHRDAA